MSEKSMFDRMWSDKGELLKALKKSSVKKMTKASFDYAVGGIQQDISELQNEILDQYASVIEEKGKGKLDMERLIKLKEDIAQRKQALIYLQELCMEFMSKDLSIDSPDDEDSE